MKQNESMEIATSVKRPKFYQITIRKLVDELYDGGKGALNLEPKFQRKSVWRLKSCLIG